MQNKLQLGINRNHIIKSLLLCLLVFILSCELMENNSEKQSSGSNNSIREIFSANIDNPLPAAEYPLGDIPLTKAEYNKFLKTPVTTKTVEKAITQGTYDARNEGIVTAAKNQGNCGSCWAFASVGALESHLIKKYTGVFNLNIDLSEQQQVSCNTGQSGCSGGNSNAIIFWAEQGSALETCFPYTASNSSCSYCSNYIHEIVYDYKVTNYYTVNTGDVNQVKTSLLNNGPSYFRFNVYSDFFDFWNYGTMNEVYINHTSTYQGGHAVLIIGWDDSKGAYLCKNSWGRLAGPNDDGTFWIAYCGHTNNLGFGMANFDVTLPCDPRPCVDNTCVECSSGTCQ